MEIQDSVATKDERKDWISLLSSAEPSHLEAVRRKLNSSIDYTYITRPETGMIMVRAKADGSKARFNLGEVTISRCVLEVKQKYLGVSWVMGSDLKHAELAALFDGLLQDPEYHKELIISLIKMLKEKQKAKDETLARDVADTKVEFFTLKRGE